MPAVTIRFDMTKHDMRKGRNTASPVSISAQRVARRIIAANDAHQGEE